MVRSQEVTDVTLHGSVIWRDQTLTVGGAATCLDAARDEEERSAFAGLADQRLQEP